MALKFGFFQPVHVNNFRIIFIFVDKIVNFVNKFDHRQIVAHDFVDKRKRANVVDNLCMKGTGTRGWLGMRC